MLLAGDHLLVISRGGLWAEPLPAAARMIFAPQPATTTLTEVDVSRPGALKVVQTLTLDGSYVDARMIGSAVRLVSSTAVPIGARLRDADGHRHGAVDAARARTRRCSQRSRAIGVAADVPARRSGARRPLVQCRDVRQPASFSGLGMLTVTTIDLAKGLAPSTRRP